MKVIGLPKRSTLADLVKDGLAEVVPERRDESMFWIPELPKLVDWGIGSKACWANKNQRKRRKAQRRRGR